MEKSCIICNSLDSKYKCPDCFLHYCSAICCKLHKSFNCGQFASAPKLARVVQRNEEDEEPQVNPTAVAVAARDLLSVSNDRLKIILENPQLKSFREHMTGSTNFADVMTHDMPEPQ